MSPLQVYLWCHLALVAVLVALGVRRLLRRDPLILFSEDMLHVLIAFILLGGGAVGIARYFA